MSPNAQNDTVVIYTKFITLKNGKRIYASQKGLDAFRIEIPRSKYKSR